MKIVYFFLEADLGRNKEKNDSAVNRIYYKKYLADTI